VNRVVALHLVIRGSVQGVGYRASMEAAAAASGVSGWVRNLRDGAVEAYVQGEAAAVEKMVAWCRRGPPAARVTSVEAEVVPTDPSIADFRPRSTG
jgi:acylphosphatase